jgi:hypothetical protein
MIRSEQTAEGANKATIQVSRQQEGMSREQEKEGADSKRSEKMA